MILGKIVFVIADHENQYQLVGLRKPDIHPYAFHTCLYLLLSVHIFEQYTVQSSH